MRAVIVCALGVLYALGVSGPAQATKRTIVGTVTGIGTGSNNYTAAETFLFHVSNSPPVTGCTQAANGWFAFSPSSITDAQTRKNLMANLLEAKATGASVTVVYDDAGGFCDAVGYPAPFWVDAE